MGLQLPVVDCCSSAAVICAASGTIEASSIFKPAELSSGPSTNAPKFMWDLYHSKVFRALHERACAAHAIATFLIDNPHN